MEPVLPERSWGTLGGRGRRRRASCAGRRCGRRPSASRLMERHRILSCTPRTGTMPTLRSVGGLMSSVLANCNKGFPQHVTPRRVKLDWKTYQGRGCTMTYSSVLLEALGGVEHAAAISANVALRQFRQWNGLIGLRRRQPLG